MSWRKKVSLLLIALILVLVEKSFFSAFPNLLTPVFVFSLSLAFMSIKQREESLFIAFWGGIFTDMFSDKIFGLSCVLFVALILFLSFLQRKLFDNLFLFAFGLLAFSFIWLNIFMDAFEPFVLIEFFINNIVAFLFIRYIFLGRYGSKSL